MDLEKRMAELKAASDAKRNKIKLRRAADWERVKQEFPEHAEFITEVAKHFGKAHRFALRDKNGKVIDSRDYR